MAACPELPDYRICDFFRPHAAVVASWVATSDELFQLAPSTTWPLNAEKVLTWPKPQGQAYVLNETLARRPVAYGEINPMKGMDSHLWLGHIVVAPSHRSRGIGTRFIRELIHVAFHLQHAARLSLVVFPENLPAIRCYRRAGFKNMGEERHSFTTGGPKYRLIRFECGRGPAKTQ